MIPPEADDPREPPRSHAPVGLGESYLEFLAQRRNEPATDFEEFCSARPAMARALRQLHERLSGSSLDSGAPISLGFSQKLLDRYGLGAPSSVDGLRPALQAPDLASEVEPLAAPHRYEVKGEVARGGMGAILEVWDRGMERSLAMKVILEERRGAGQEGMLLQRFLREARVTGRLDHPGVVPVHEIGIDPGLGVYFTMRLVEGRDLRQVFDVVRAREDGWTRQRALEVILKACDTMAYCHAKGVVHRDLKPANIMVGNFGEVYVMDWGLARLDGEPEDSPPAESSAPREAPGVDAGVTLTRDGVVLGTPAYMPPEQALALNELVGPAADVYAMGAMLYALLAGRAPYRDEEASAKEVLDAVRAGPPTRVALLNPSAPPGLVSICERAMMRDPSERYPSMLDMARALRDYLESEQQAAREAERARADAENARRVASFLASIFAVSHPEEARGGNVSAREIIDRGAERIEQDLADQPIVQATLKHTLGEIYRNLGLAEPASRMLEAALAMWESGPCADPLEAARTLTALGSVRALQGSAGDSEPLFRRALDLRRKELGENHALVAASLSDVAVALWERGDYRGAEPVIRDAVALMRQLHGDRKREMAPVLVNMALVLFSQQRFEEAVPFYCEALDILRATAPASIEAASCANNLGDCYFAMGDFARAWSLQEESVRLRKNLYDARHPATATGYHNQGATMVSWGDASRALPLLELALDIRREKLGDEHPAVATCLVNLATCALDQGRLEDAESLHRRALQIRERSLGPDSPVVAVSLAGLATVLIAAERWDEAEALHLRSLRIRRERLGKDFFATWTNELGLAAIEHGRRQFASARQRVEQVLAAFEQQLPEHPRVASARYRLARILEDCGELEAAREAALAAHALREKCLLSTHPARKESRELLVRLGVAQPPEAGGEG